MSQYVISKMKLKMEKIMSDTHLIKSEEIQNKIHTFRGIQVMLDSDLAELYGVETKQLNRAVKRNKDRFPQNFMFQLNESEWENLKLKIGDSNEMDKSLRYQNGTLNKENNLRGSHRKYISYVFSEQGVAMLSAVLKSETAVKVSVIIMNAFVAMRRFLISNAKVFARLDTLELKQLDTDKKIEHVLSAIETKEIMPKQGIFFDGQIFDAYKFVAGLVRKVNKSILLIDNYIDETVLDLFSKKKKNVKVTIFTN